MNEDEGNIDCDEHGSQPAAFACRHLLESRDAGFHQGFDPERPYTLFPDAWCDACEAVLDEEGGWTDRALSFADIRLLCGTCYLKVRMLNWPSSTHAELARLVDLAVPYVNEKQDVLRSQFHLSEHERYDWYQESGQLIFSNRGTPAVIAAIQFVGSVSTYSNTWLWSWSNESFLEDVRAKLHEVRAYGEKHSLLKLACPYWEAAEEDGWEMAAISAYLLGAKGVYRSPDENGFTFLLLMDIQWAQ